MGKDTFGMRWLVPHDFGWRIHIWIGISSQKRQHRSKYVEEIVVLTTIKRCFKPTMMSMYTIHIYIYTYIHISMYTEGYESTQWFQCDIWNFGCGLEHEGIPKTNGHQIMEWWWLVNVSTGPQNRTFTPSDGQMSSQDRVWIIIGFSSRTVDFQIEIVESFIQDGAPELCLLVYKPH